MKRHIALMLCIACITGLSGCANPYQKKISTEQTAEKSDSHNVKTISLSAAAAEADSEYTLTDVTNLQDFLLTRPTEDLSGKNYDLDGDNAWTVFDLCLMKKDILGDLIQSDIPIVYMTKDISADGLMNAYLSLGWQPEGNTAVKLSTGEPPNSNYLHGFNQRCCRLCRRNNCGVQHGLRRAAFVNGNALSGCKRPRIY